MYTVIGRRKGIAEQARLHLPDLLDKPVSDSLIGFYIRVLPDGFIVERRGQWFETLRGELKPLNMLDPGEITREGAPYGTRPFTREDFSCWMDEARQLARAWAKRG